MQAVAGYNARRSLFEHYVRTRAEEERKEKRAAQKAAVVAFKQLLEEAKKVCRGCLIFSFLLNYVKLLALHLRTMCMYEFALSLYAYF